MAQNEGERCSKAMGCDGVRCIWDAGKQKCTKWCRAHARKWVPSLLAALDNVTDPGFPALFTVDKLIFEGKNGAYLRGSKDNLYRLIVDESPANPFTTEDLKVIDEEVTSTSKLVSNGKLTICNAKLTVCGLAGNPSEEILSEWDSQFTYMDILEFTKFKGFHKRVLSVQKANSEEKERYLTRMFSGVSEDLTRDKVIDLISTAMADPAIKGTRLLFEFKLVIQGMGSRESMDICSTFDVKDPSEVDMYKSVSSNSGRTYLMEPKMSGGGAHLSLDCGSFVVHWHTLGFLLFSVPSISGDCASVDLVMHW